MSEKKEYGADGGNQTLSEKHLHGSNDPKRAERTPEYKGGYAGPNSGGPADQQKDE